MNRTKLYAIMITTAVILIGILLITRYTYSFLNNLIPMFAIIGMIALIVETIWVIKIVKAEYKEG